MRGEGGGLKWKSQGVCRRDILMCCVSGGYNG